MLAMAKIGVLSDTHLTRVTEEFSAIVSTLFRDADLIIHAGDMVSREVYDYLCTWNVRAVAGNMDGFDLAGLLPGKRVEVIEGKRIGIVHGAGPPYAIEQRVLGQFTQVDAIVFGHSHMPALTRHGDVVLFNPGAFRNPSTGVRTVGMIELGEAGMSFKHIPVK